MCFWSMYRERREGERMATCSRVMITLFVLSTWRGCFINCTAAAAADGEARSDIHKERDLQRHEMREALYRNNINGSRPPVVPALFVLGDSLADAGNNNHFRSLAKANYHPYGMNYPGGVATGRFANGYTAMDYLSFKLGLPLAPIYEDPSTKGSKLLQGVNFASGASGIQPYTGSNFGRVSSLDQQIQQLASVKQEIVELIGPAAADDLFAQSLFYVVTGSNDWLNTYFFPASPLPRLYTQSQFRDILISKLLSHAEALYNLGARKIGLASLGPLGCSPSQLRAYKSNGTCVDSLNQLVVDFNDHLRPQFLNLPTKLPNLKIIYNNLYTPILNVIANPNAHGFSITNQACCGIGKFGGFLNCFPRFPVCDNVQDHLYWDAYHPTSKFYTQFVDLVWNYGPPYSYPDSGKKVLCGQ